MCPRCPYKYLLRGFYIKHYFDAHLNLFNKNSSTSTVCKLCSGGKVVKLNSEIHFKNFHQIKEGMEPHKCEKCPAYFRKPFQLYFHNIKVHEQDNKCKFCGESYKTRWSLINHLKHHGENNENPDLPFGCEFSECKKRFGTAEELDHHKVFSHYKSGWRYERTKTFICEKCEDGKDFGTGTSLKTHLAKVHGEMPFVCEECGKGFKIKAALNTHMLFHKGPEVWKWECAECGKKCSTKQKWEEHGRTHTKEKPFVCQFCGERYAHRHNWKGHLRGKHGNEEGVEEEIGKYGKNRKGNYIKRKGSKKGDCIMAK